MLKQIKSWLSSRKKLNLGYTRIVVQEEDDVFVLGVITFYMNANTGRRSVKLHTSCANPIDFIRQYNCYYWAVEVQEWLDDAADLYEIIKNPSQLLKDTRRETENKRWDEKKLVWVTNLNEVEKIN